MLCLPHKCSWCSHCLIFFGWMYHVFHHCWRQTECEWQDVTQGTFLTCNLKGGLLCHGNMYSRVPTPSMSHPPAMPSRVTACADLIFDIKSYLKGENMKRSTWVNDYRFICSGLSITCQRPNSPSNWKHMVIKYLLSLMECCSCGAYDSATHGASCLCLTERSFDFGHLWWTSRFPKSVGFWIDSMIL